VFALPDREVLSLGEENGEDEPGGGSEGSYSSWALAAFFTALFFVLGGLALATPYLVGFGGPGVSAGSLASMWQGFIGNVVKGSCFALLQSFGAIYPFAPVIGGLLVVVGVGVLVYLAYSYYPKEASANVV
jgi:hypothetical protein